MAYKFRCSLLGHEKDVRSLYPSLFPEGGVISGSRDVTARVWIPDESGIGFQEAHVMSGHNNFVSCVCVMPPDETHPQGLIVTGSHDNNILAFTLESPQPVFKLEGHEDTVCTLAAGKFGSLISGSWDKTAKVWLKEKCVMTLKGHEAAVWAVAIMPEGGFMLSGSADRSIKLWRAGKCERTYTGHDDCVRGLAVLSTQEFLSCSNDATVRRWLISGACTHTYYGHTNFVYSIAVLPGTDDFVTTSEDRSLKVWKNGECIQTIVHPTTSVWCVTVLNNGDIATGGSDGTIRVFSMAAERQADEEAQKLFEEEVAGSAIPAQVGDIKTDQLSGKEALLNPGKKDGQTLMVKDGNKIEAHQWNAAEGRWVKIGDVVGGSGGSQSASGKQLFEGKEYDYVFDVELTEGRPALKLPYNIGDDPWMVAHHWLQKNELSPMFLDQVANFIQEQTKGVTIGQQAPTSSDPFTGAGRYIPGTGDGRGGATANSSDPFTGAGRYVPQGASAQNMSTGGAADPFTGSGAYTSGSGTLSGAGAMKSIINTYFPKTSYLSFETAKPDGIIGKLKELGTKAPADSQVSVDHLDAMVDLITLKNVTATHIDTLWKILHWPNDIVFPALDILRLALRSLEVNQHFLNAKDGPQFIQFLLQLITPDAPAANVMLVLRSLTNAFLHSPGEAMLLAQKNEIFSAILQVKSNANKNVQIAASSLLLNYAVAFRKSQDIEGKAQCLSAAGVVSESVTDSEASFRLLVGIGTIIQDDKNSIELAKSMDMSVFVNKCLTVADPSKVHECAKFVGDILKITT